MLTCLATCLVVVRAVDKVIKEVKADAEIQVGQTGRHVERYHFLEVR